MMLLIDTYSVEQHFKQGQLQFMIANSRILVSILSTFTAKLLTKVKNRITPNMIKNNLTFQKILMGSGFLLGLGYVHAIEDQTIRNLRSNMNKHVSYLRAEFGQTTVYPDISYELKGSNYEIKFLIDQRKCDLFTLISNFMTIYNTQKQFKVIDMKAFAKDDVITFYVQFEENDPKFKTPQKGRLTLSGTTRNDVPSIRVIFNKDGTITDKNIKGLQAVYREAVKPKQIHNKATETPSGRPKAQGSSKKGKGNQIYAKLNELGLTVFDPLDKTIELDWDCLAGYAHQKRLIEDTILLALNYPEVYDEITQQTRVKYEPNRPKAVLFEGPPGTGKTTSAKIIAQQVNIPLIYIPTEAIMSKYYGESETKLAAMWEMCEQLGKVIIFIDEIDALAGNRSTDMHEASRRILSTLLRKIDSFESSTNVLLICATNRKVDLDPAMLSRIDLSVAFSLPDKQSRAEIFKRYAKHLSEKELAKLAAQTEEFSGRNISDICKNAERRWASKLIRKQVIEKLPTLQEYLQALNERRMNHLA